MPLPQYTSPDTPLMLIYEARSFFPEVISMGNFDIKEFLQSDIGSYGIVMPVVGGAAAAGFMSMGAPATAAGVAGLYTGSILTGILRGVSGAEATRGMTSMELRQAAGLSAVLTGLVWAAGKFGNIQQASALIKAAEDTAKTTASAAKNPVGSGVWYWLTFLGSAFGMFLGAIAVSELVADWTGGKK